MLTATRNARTRQLSRGAIAAGVAALGLVGLAAPASAENYRLVKTYGSGGDQDGQFKNPGGVVLGSENTRDTVIVADTINSRIQVFYADDGSFIRKWGTEGSGNTELSAPEGIARDSAGNVWVADTGNNRIKRFDGQGVVNGGWGESGSAAGQFNAPNDVAIGPGAQGKVYVADTGNNRIQVFNAGTGQHEETWGGALGSGDKEFDRPEAITTDANGNVYVADTGNHRVQVFDAGGTFLRKFGSHKEGDDDVWDPAGIAVNPAGNVIVANHGLIESIVEFGPTGTFIRKLPGRQFHRPSGLTTDAAGNLFVADSDNFEIKKMTLSPELTVKNSAASVQPGSFGYVVNGTTIAANHPPGMQETILIERGIDVTVSEVDGAGGFSVASYTVSVDCGAGSQAATSIKLTNFTADTTCTFTNTRPSIAPPGPGGPTPPVPGFPLPGGTTPGGTTPTAAKCKVPKLKRNSTLKATKTALTKARCKAGKVSRAASKTVRKGKVIKLKKKAGTLLKTGTKVDIVVSSGPKR